MLRVDGVVQSDVPGQDSSRAAQAPNSLEAVILKASGALGHNVTAQGGLDEQGFMDRPVSRPCGVCLILPSSGRGRTNGGCLRGFSSGAEFPGGWAALASWVENSHKTKSCQHKKKINVWLQFQKYLSQSVGFQLFTQNIGGNARHDEELSFMEHAFDFLGSRDGDDGHRAWRLPSMRW